MEDHFADLSLKWNKFRIRYQSVKVRGPSFNGHIVDWKENILRLEPKYDFQGQSDGEIGLEATTSLEILVDNKRKIQPLKDSQIDKTDFESFWQIQTMKIYKVLQSTILGNSETRMILL